MLLYETWGWGFLWLISSKTGNFVLYRLQVKSEKKNFFELVLFTLRGVMKKTVQTRITLLK